MRRILTIILACIAAGLITTVVTCWVCAAQSAVTPVATTTEDEATWRRRRPPHCRDEPQAAYSEAVGAKSLRRVILRSYAWADAEHPATHAFVFTEAGWPWPGLRGGEWLIGPGYLADPTKPHIRNFGAVRVGGDEPSSIIDLDHRTYLPLMPMWPGFHLNTAVFSATWAMLILLPLIARRLLRRKVGVCRRCGYPRGESERCTECGTRHAAPLVGEVT